jgi:aminoglycoside 3-N-acetyltransferase
VITNSGPILENGERIWRWYRDYDENSEIFPDIGADWERAQPDAVTIGKVGSAESRLFLQRQGVDLAEQWLRKRST